MYLVVAVSDYVSCSFDKLEGPFRFTVVNAKESQVSSSPFGACLANAGML